MENENDDLDILTQEEETESYEEADEPEESVDEIKARLAKAEELRDNYKIRAEKAENKSKQTKESPKQTQGDLSSKDLYALMEAKVPQEDIDEVTEYAKFAKISVADALKNNVVKTILKEKAEMRNVAEATNTGTARRTTGKMSEDALLDKASKGEMPESDDEIARLIAARRNRK